MARSTRLMMRRELEHIEKNVKWIKVHLLRVADSYAENHPEISDIMLQLCDFQDEFFKRVVDVRNRL